MKETVNVSIAGISFILDHEGYKLLKDYLVRIELGYRESSEGKEVVSDIEARICELILNEQSADLPVPADRIRAIIEQMGMPEDINPDAKDSPADPAEKFPRRLYRNPDGAKLGGVCSGLATYFNTEVVLIRLLFFLPLLLCPLAGVFHWEEMAGIFGTLFGVGFMLYFVLWFVIPKAKTPRQKLEMRGEKITVATIHQNLREDFQQVSPGEKGERNASVLSELVGVLGRIALFLIKAILLLIGGIIACVVIGLFVGLFSVLFGGSFLGITALSAVHLNGVSGGMLAVLLGLLLLLPLLMLGYLLLRMVFRLPTQKKTLSIIFGIWVLVMIYVGVIAVRNYETISDSVRTGRFELIVDEEYTPNKNWVDGADSTWSEVVTIGDSVITDTVKREYFSE